MEVTLRQIEEDDRFKLPFYVIHNTYGKVLIDKISYTGTKNGKKITFWDDREDLFPELCTFPKESKYIPFTQDDWEQFADEWIRFIDFDRMFKLTSVDKHKVSYTMSKDYGIQDITYEALLKKCEFAKTNKPCGKLLQE